MAEFTVRPARPEDTEPAFELFADWQRSSYGEVEIGPEMFATTLAGADAVFVAETEDGLVGHSDVDGGWIGLGVARAARRRGIGTALLEEAEGAATTDTTWLVGLSTEPAAAAFAAANGYEKAWEVWLMGIDLPEEIPEPRVAGRRNRADVRRGGGGSEGDQGPARPRLCGGVPPPTGHLRELEPVHVRGPDVRRGRLVPRRVRRARSWAPRSTGTRATSRISSSTPTGAAAGSGRPSSTRPSANSSAAGYPA